MSSSEQSYSFSAVAAAVGVPINTVRTWLKRKHIWFDKHELQLAETAGLPHRVFMPSVMRMAIMARLVSYGMPPMRAWHYTVAFTDIGIDARDPGALFPTGRTLFVAYPEEQFGYVVNELPGQQVDLRFPVGLPTKRADDYLVIDLSALYARVENQLQHKAD